MIASEVIDQMIEEMINKVGTLICQGCIFYDMQKPQNCSQGYVAPSDCQIARNVIIRRLEDR